MTTSSATSGYVFHSSEIAHAQTCDCPSCGSLAGDDAEPAAASPERVAATAYTYDPASGTYTSLLTTLDPSSPLSGLVGTYADNNKPIWSAYRAAQEIARPSGTWADYTQNLVVTFSFGDADTIGDGNEAFDAQDRLWAMEAMNLYADVSGLTFREAANGETANISFFWEAGSTNGGGWAYYPWPGGSEVHVGHAWWEADNEMEPGTYGLNLLLHELGHAVGLAHPGAYNGEGFSYEDADHWNDSAQYSNMSYWSGSETGASFDNLATLALHDILATQIEYGVNTETRSDNTVYGFHSTAGRLSYDLDYMRSEDRLGAGFAIWDGGGTDTIDFSRSSTVTGIDLREGGFSSVNGQVYNVSIAYGAVIENAIGSAHKDFIRGNAVGNHLLGGSGDDIMLGGEEAASVSAEEVRDFTGISLNEAPQTRDQYLSVDGLQALSGQGFTLEMMIAITRVSSSLVAIASYAVPGSASELTIDGESGGNLRVRIDGRAHYVTSVATADLVDGEAHRLSITWSRADGELRTYIDGSLVDAGTYEAGASLQSGGTLIFGQEQGSLGGAFDESEVFQGTIDDIRIFDIARTEEEIAVDAFAPVDPSQPGLVHNWQAAASDTTSVSDLVGGRDLIIHNGAEIVDTAAAATYPADDDVIEGGDGHDNLRGGYGNDRLVGGEGSDTLIGGVGNDTLVGDDGSAGHTAIEGLVCNAGGATGQSIRSDTATGLPLEAMTLEYVLCFDGVPQRQWFLEMPGVRLLIDSSEGAIFVQIGGTWSYSGITAGRLADGEAHRISVAWDGATGTARHYLDGGLIQIDRELPSGVVLSPTGTGAVVVNPVAAAIGDIRLYDHMLTDDEIQANALVPLADPAGADGLVLNWQVRPDGTVVDAAGGAAPVVTGADTARTLVAASTFDDILDGESGDDRLEGGVGDDHLIGGLGRDVLLGGEGFDVLEGGDGYDILEGGAGDDRLNGGISFDHMYGGAGDDTYVVDHSGDRVIEAADEGIDTVETARTVYTLTDNVENFRFTGTSSMTATGNTLANVIEGGRGHDKLYGGNGRSVDTLIGGDGNDYLYGGSGDDIMRGGDGNDTYVIHDAGDIVEEDANQGAADWVMSSVVALDLRTYSGVENGRITGSAALALTGDDGANRLLGSTGANVVRGGGGNDTIDGGGGTDTLYGGAGDDTFTVDSTGDQVLELDGEGAADWVTTSAIDLDLNRYSGVENARLNGSRDLDLTGNSGANYLYGNSGDNIIAGGSGQDRLRGYGGDDVFDFNAISDSAAGSTTRDIIYDFTLGDDVIDLSGIDARASSGSSNDAFSFIGDDGFSGTAGELRYYTTTSATYVEADVNGDAAADFQVLLSGVYAFRSVDFVL